MKILHNTLISVIILIMIVILTNNTVINTLANSSLNNNRRVANIGVLLYSFNDLYMSQIKQSLEDIQKNNENIVNFTFFDSQNNQAIQNEIISSLPSRTFDLLVIDLSDTKKEAVKDVIDRAKEKNIPLIIFNIDPSAISADVKKSYDKVFFLTTDSKQLGTLQGDILVKQWNFNKDLIDKNKDNVMQYIVLQGYPNSTAALDRTKYAISAINNSEIKTEQIEIKNAYWDKQIAEISMESLILKYADKIEVVISNNDAMAIGAIEALQKYGYNKNDKSKYISVVGIDALPEAKDLVDKGIMTGTVTQNPASVAEAIYKIGVNLVNNVNPLENTNYKLEDKEFVNIISYEEYAK